METSFDYTKRDTQQIKITEADYARCNFPRFLNDNVVDVWADLLLLEKPNVLVLDCRFCGSFFPAATPDEAYNNVYKFNLGNVLNNDYLIFTINHADNHWIAAIVVLQQPWRVLISDSIRKPDTAYIKYALYIRSWLNYLNRSVQVAIVPANASKKFNLPPPPLAEQDIVYTPESMPCIVLNSPQQVDGCNCGIFMLRAIEIASTAETCDQLEPLLEGCLFSTEDALVYRCRMAKVFQRMQAEYTWTRTVKIAEM